VVEYRGPVPRDKALGQHVPINATVGLEVVVRQREPLIIPDTEGDSPLARAWQQSAHAVQKRLIGNARSWLGVPLVIKDRVIGVLRLGHEKPGHFSAHHAALAAAFGSHAAVAMENARLYRQAGALAALEERQRLARDLHDAVSQTLFSASLTADVLPTLYDRDPAHGKELLRELQELNRGAMAEMRMLLLELRPAALLEVDLATLLRHLGEGAAARARLKATVTGQGPGRLPSDVQVALFRIAQEAINNVIKHAQATSVTIGLAIPPLPGETGDRRRAGGEAKGVEMSIVDDGRGFDPAQAQPHQLGMGIMAERAAAIGADLTIESAPGKGTSVTVVWTKQDGKA
jgi:two-component system nitrate/nitrite sensor histidine kinase NarX